MRQAVKQLYVGDRNRNYRMEVVEICRWDSPTTLRQFFASFSPVSLISLIFRQFLSFADFRASR